MKKIFILLTVVGFLSACTEYDFFEDQGYTVAELPGYVAFNGAGTSVNYTVDPIDECAAAGVELEVEAPTGTLSDITVNYTLGGTAEFGTDYTIDGATASGGSFVIEHRQSADPNDFQNLDNGTFTIVPLVDGVSEGDETVEVTLVSATNADGETFDVGRGGTDYLKTVSVSLVDVDFDITPTGTFDVVRTGDYGDATGGTAVITEVAPGQYQIDDVAQGVFTTSFGFAFDKAACGWSVAGGDPAADIVLVAGSYDAAGVLTLVVTLNCCGVEGTSYTLVCTPQ